MSKFTLPVFFVMGFFMPVLAFSQTVPEVLIRPVTGEAPRYPRDVIIGTLGQGEAPDRAWQYALRLMDALITGDGAGLAASGGELPAARLEALAAISPLRYNIGGGRIEEDGSVSFLFRFLGREQWMAGELYLRPNEDDWLLDDIVLEEGRKLGEGNSYPHDFSPYERFF